MPKISVIIPMYGVEKYIRRCLDSMLNQTFTDWQAICVDDGSPDKSGEIAEEFAKKDKRFTVVHKQNGGLSDARNAGFEYAKGDYVLYIDSDDFIHPQTLELAYNCAVRDGSDIVSFRYDRIYRPQLMVRHKLGLDTDNVVPHSITKKYNLEKVKTRVTDDIFEYATERTHNKFNPNRRWLIKHCQVWKNLYKRELIADIPYIKGIIFEDFPWWSRVMLKNPRTTILPLPLYYYIPNFGGIVLAAKQLRIIKSLCTGIADAFCAYKESATEYQMKKWQENFLWFFVDKVFYKTKYLSDKKDLDEVKVCFENLKNIGLFDCYPNEWYDLVCNIQTFLGKGDDK